ncbi:hypothetical protein ILYODFUR_024143 [Ilyodon furcidens]|uniref:Uncharacterized protein n=1 Tax=Ilyodon furcidens TaxID=33524 RepID=A0ABV0UUT8_9TELE
MMRVCEILTRTADLSHFPQHFPNSLSLSFLFYLSTPASLSFPFLSFSSLYFPTFFDSLPPMLKMDYEQILPHVSGMVVARQHCFLLAKQRNRDLVINGQNIQ